MEKDLLRELEAGKDGSEEDEEQSDNSGDDESGTVQRHIFLHAFLTDGFLELNK